MQLDVRVFIPHIGTDAPQSMLYTRHRMYMERVSSVSGFIVSLSLQEDKVSDYWVEHLAA